MQNILITLLLAALAALAAWKLKPEKEQVPAAPPVVSVQEMGTLATLRVNYANVIEFNERITQDIPWTQWEFRFGGTSVLLIARGECLIGTDLQAAKYEQILPAGARQATCRLGHAANGGISSRREAAATTESRSGLSVTVVMCVQSRVWPDQRAGLRSRAWR